LSVSSRDTKDTYNLGQWACGPKLGKGLLIKWGDCLRKRKFICIRPAPQDFDRDPHIPHDAWVSSIRYWHTIAILFCFLSPAMGQCETVSGSSVSLFWDAPTDPGLDFYRVLRSDTPIGAATPTDNITMVTANSALDLEPLQQAYYVMTAVYTDRRESGFSNELCVILQAPAIPAKPLPMTLIATLDDPTTPPELIISNLTAQSPRAYVLGEGLSEGAIKYTDRTIQYGSLPPILQGLAYILTANDDKSSSGSAFLSFDVNRAVIVYVAHRFELPPPPWLQQFVPTSLSVSGGGVFDVFSKGFPQGSVILGGNIESGTTGRSMYTVMIQ